MSPCQGHVHSGLKTLWKKQGVAFVGHWVTFVARMPWVYQETPAPRSWVLSNHGYLRKIGDGKTHVFPCFLLKLLREFLLVSCGA